MNREEIKERLKTIQSLPTLPPIVARLNNMVNDEDVTAVKLGKIIEKDQVLTSKILKMVNSSFFGFPQRISTVPNALVLLGFNVIKTLIVTSSIFEVMQASDVGLFEHSLGVAAAAGILARKHQIKNPEEISTAGLIHDLGKIVVRAELPDEYEKVLDIVDSRKIPMRTAEMEVLGMDHCEIGSDLASEWNLPDRLIAPVKLHHRPAAKSDFATINAIIHFSDILIRALGFGNGGDLWVPDLDLKAWEGIKLSRTETKDLLNELDEKLCELQDFTVEIKTGEN
jgi:putative nucleotidyltransferase with HDIG domain